MASNNISSLSHNECCGCRACGDICPKNCIAFSEDSEGFFYPHVNSEECISCGKCMRVCPELTPSFHKEPESVLAAYANDDEKRRAGTSGGLFGLIATEVINQGGKVWGASFNGELQLIHTSATNENELSPILRSKYIQSNTEGIYAQIKDDLKSGILTLFSGTPCQCNAVRNAVGNHDKLITVDIVCHGVPSQSLFDKNIEYLEQKKAIKIVSFSFRSKYKNAPTPRVFSYKYIKKDKEKVKNSVFSKFPFLYGFYKYLTIRPSCYYCKWTKPQRTSDITLGDFWGIEKYDKCLDSHDGLSQVITNTPKGQSIINRLIEKKTIYSKVFPIETAINNNECLKNPTKKPIEREKFFHELETKPFSDVIKEYLVPKRGWILDIYFGMPNWARKLLRKLR